MSMQAREGSSQDGAQHLGTKGGVTAVGASLVYLLGKTQLWARTSDAWDPVVYLLQKGSMKHSSLTLTLFQIRVNGNKGRPRL